MRNDGVQAVGRALGLMRLFTLRQPELTLAEISERSGLPKSTCHRLLMSLEREGFISSTHPGRYGLGLAIAQLSDIAADRLRPSPAIQEELRALCAQTEETVGLTILQNRAVLVIERVESAHPFRMQYGIGTRLPLHSTASGKLLLALSATEDLIRSIPLEVQTATTLTSRDALEAELQRIREQGFATDHEEMFAGLSCLAVPLLDRYGNVAASLGISGPTARIHPSADLLLAKLRQCAERVKGRLDALPTSNSQITSAGRRSTSEVQTAATGTRQTESRPADGTIDITVLGG